MNKRWIPHLGIEFEGSFKHSFTFDKKKYRARVGRNSFGDVKGVEIKGIEPFYRTGYDNDDRLFFWFSLPGQEKCRKVFIDNWRN